MHASATSNAPSSSAANASVIIPEKAREWFLLLLVGVLIGFCWVTYTQMRVLEMRVEGFTRALIAHGIKDTYPHLPGEDD